MFVVIISTISSGRVQRKHFENWDEATECAREFDERRSTRKGRDGRRLFRVELQRCAPATPLISLPLPAPAITTEAAA